MRTTHDTLEPIEPSTARELFLKHKATDVGENTVQSYSYRTEHFVRWCDENGIDDMNDVGGRQLMEFKTWRKTESDLTSVSLNGNLATLQRFLRFCENVDAVPEGLADRVPLSNVPPEEEVNDWVPTDDAVEGIRLYFRRFEYTSRRHVMFELIAEVGLRLGAVRATDLEDVDPDEMVIHLRHRPEGTEEYGTPLKNGRDGGRIINISEQLCGFIVDYVEYNRVRTEDRYGREPMFTTSGGRPSTATIRRDFYKMTRPCVYSEECPHEREISECEATKNMNVADCPGRFSTHPLRKWAIMHQLDAGVPKELLSDRVDVSVPILDKHYDQRTEERKSRRRREALEASLEEYVVTDGGRLQDTE